MKKQILLLGIFSILMSSAAYSEQSPQLPDGTAPHAQELEHKNITRAEFIKHAEDRFSKMDANNNGELSLEERKASYQKFRENRQDRKERQNERNRRKQSPPSQ